MGIALRLRLIPLSGLARRLFRPPPKPRGYRFGTLTLILLIIIMLSALGGCTAVAQ